ncbi:MAG: hypothetical protein JOZ47_21880 [Kutzneria sp.]|nr:hypothetical protein [Kutzneria sp.]MBV9847698.1 hypothetical protein [Kutzneria sp.]
MNVVDTIAVLVLIPLAIYGVIALLTLWPKFARAPRYRPGQRWDYASVWWTANPAGLGSADRARAVSEHGPATEPGAQDDTPVHTARGGARGSW